MLILVDSGLPKVLREIWAREQNQTKAKSSQPNKSFVLAGPVFVPNFT